ncbi:hypothetical protein OsJ_26646 [Oryza sativa Japonica Group]|uniref:Uncharacterized protein n=1 Tax=Oryza sativa subsp. japonica TaxID=39947 RepID=B9FZX9_ORYSJ|nr:hypothetical protein OsJ_26646 [Oryza sativa Japonica Group]
MAGGRSGATTLGRGGSAALGSGYGNNNGGCGDILGRAVSAAQEAVAATMTVGGNDGGQRGQQILRCHPWERLRRRR